MQTQSLVNAQRTVKKGRVSCEVLCSRTVTPRTDSRVSCLTIPSFLALLTHRLTSVNDLSRTLRGMNAEFAMSVLVVDHGAVNKGA